MTKQQSNEHHFIKIYNSYLTEGSKNHMDEKELYLYSTIFKHKNIDGYMVTSINMLGEIMDIEFSKRKTRNNQKIKDVLNDFSKKGIVKITKRHGEVIEELKTLDTIWIYLNQNDEKGHVQIQNQNFDKFESLSDFYIYSAVAKWQHSKEKFECSYGRWAKILQVDKSTAIAKVNDAISRGIIYKNSGDYISDGTQSQNVYSIYPFAENEKSIMTKRNEIDKANIEFRENLKAQYSDAASSMIPRAITIFSTFEYEGHGVYPMAAEYAYCMYVYSKNSKTEEESELLKVAESRVKMLRNNKPFNKTWEEAEEIYRSSFNKESDFMKEFFTEEKNREALELIAFM